jgi:hypothetical protein
MSTPTRPPVVYPNYVPAHWSYIVDKTGAIYQTINGNVGGGTPWGFRVWRTAPNQKPQLMYYGDGSGILIVSYKKLYALVTDAQWQQWIVQIDGYIDPDDTPSSTIVDVNEAQVAGLKQSIATAQQLAQQASSTANNAQSDVKSLQDTVKQLQQKVDAQQNTITALQLQVSQLLTPSQVSDLVWQKLKDMNYLYRLAFIAWPALSPDVDIRAYVNDLVNLIRKVGKA